MNCQVCTSRVSKTANFCPRCGHPIPILVGASYPYGIRFPAPQKKSNYYVSVVNRAQMAPKYAERKIRGVLYHSALYDRITLNEMMPLLIMVNKMYSGRQEVIEHTTDGRTFSNRYVPWACFLQIFIEQRKVPGGVSVDHPSAKCHSYFGCINVQNRQQHYLHSDGVEMFLHGIHGRFNEVTENDMNNLVEDWNPRGLVRKLKCGEFILDKDAIRREALRFANIRCPGFSMRYLYSQIKALPNEVVVGITPDWSHFICPITRRPGVVYHCYKDRVITL